MQVKYPYSIDNQGKTASSFSEGQHIAELIEQVLFTALGERVNMPTFGSSINQLVFAPNSGELATATQFMIQASLQQWLADIISVESVVVTNKESVLYINIQYVVKKNQQRVSTEFKKEV
jgi:Bacteriophage baseplate protein W